METTLDIKENKVRQALNRLDMDNVETRQHIIGETETIALFWAGTFSESDMNELVSPMVKNIPLAFFRKIES